MKMPTNLRDAFAIIDRLVSENDDLRSSNNDFEAMVVELEDQLGEKENQPSTVQEIVSMPSLDRDRFLADLCRECALLGIEWPASPKDETARIATQ